MKRTPMAVAIFALSLVVVLPVSAAQVRQLAQLTAPDGARSDEFGFSVAISGNTVVVGSPKPVAGGEASVYVFVKSGTAWKQAAELKDGSTNDELGFSVSASADANTIAVGAPNSVTFGTVCVFVKPEGGWRDTPPTAVLTVSGGQIHLGDSVSISGDGTTIVAGAYGNGGPGTGAAYVFTKPDSGWVSTSHPTATLSSSTAWALGNSVAMSADGNTVAAGSIGRSGVGVAYVFTKPQTGWQSEDPVATLTNSDQGSIDSFAYSIAINAVGNTIAVGDPGKAVYVFVRPNTGWQTMTQTAELTVSSRGDSQLGWSVVLSGNIVLAGAPGTFIGHNNPGAVFGYLKPPGGWVDTSKPRGSVTSSDGASRDGFGQAVALSGTIGVVGAPLHAVNGNAEQGAVYIFGP